MVTRLQVGSLTSSLPGLAQEETLQRTYFRPAGDRPRAPATPLLERRSPLLPVRLLPLPRFTPRPFSKAAPGMKSPVTPWGPARPAPACGQPQDGAEEDGGDGRRRSSASAFSKADLLQRSPAAPAPAAIVPPETGRSGPAGGQGAPEVSAGFTPEPHVGSRPEVAAKPAVAARKPVGTLSRPAPLPQDPGPAAAPETSPKEPPPAQASHGDGPGDPAPDSRPRPKRRPVSAIYMDSIQLQKPTPGEVAPAGKTPPTPLEKSWVRRPRPLSMDLTARFENIEVLLRKGAEEPPARGAAPRRGPERAEPEPRVDGERPVQAEGPRDPDFLQGAPRTPEQKEKKVLPRPAETGVLRTAAANTPARDQTPGDPRDGERGQAPQAPALRPGRGPAAAAEVKSRAADWEARAPGEAGARGSLWKRVSLAEGESPLAPAAATELPPASPGSPSSSEAPGPGRVGLSVQDRVKGWAAEGLEPKVERRKKPFQARPLSVDLTRLFSSGAASPDVGYEKRAEPRDELPQEPGGKKEVGRVPDAVTSPRSPWKPGASGERFWLPEWPGQVPDRGRGGGGGSSAGAPGPAAATPEADGSFQTVRAMLFEHRVERHTVATASVAEGPLSAPRPAPRPERALWLGHDPPEDRPSRSEAFRWLLGPDAERSARSTPPAREPRAQHSCPPETPPLRADGQNCGPAPHLRPEERPHSQAVPGVPEDAAVTLRASGSRHWPKGGQRLLDTPPGHPERQPEGQGSRHRASLIWEVRGAPDVAPLKADSQEPRGTCPSPRWTRATWHQAGVSAGAEGGQERGADAPRPCGEPGSPRVRTSVTSEDLFEGRRGPGLLRLGERGPSWGRPSEAPPGGRDAAGLAQRADAVSGAGPGAAQGSEAQRVLAPEPQVRMRKAGPSDQRVDRWRRRTLPYDARFEEFSFLAPEPRRKVEQGLSEPPGPSAAAVRDLPAAHRTEAGSPGSPRDRALAPGKPLSPAEPRATFFAVTYQIPSAQLAKSTKPEAPGGPMEPSRKTAPPPKSPHLTSTAVSVDRDEAPEPEGSRNWTRGRERHGVSPSGVQMPPSVHPRPGPRREADEAGALRGREERPSVQRDRKDSGGRTAPGAAPQASPSFRSPKASDLAPWGPEAVSETLPGRAKGGYRSSVLDIDALMEEYRKQSARGGPGDAPPSPSAHASRSFPNQPGQQGGREGTRRSPKDSREAQGPWTQASSVDTNHRSTPARASYPGAAPSPPSNALLWMVPPSASPEGPRNGVSGPAEDEQRAFASRHHRTQSHGSPTEPGPATRGDPDRKPTRSGEGCGLALWGGRSPPDVKRTHSERGAPAPVREGLSVLQDAQERRWEQPPARSALPPETSDAREPRRGLGLQDSGPQDGQKARPRQASPVTTSPRRSHSFCRDKRSGPLVDQLKQCFSRRAPEAKDTDTLVQEADSQYGTWTGQRQSGDSPGPESPSPDGSAASARRQTPSSRLSSPSSPSEPPSAGDSAREQRSASVDRSSAELDSPDGTEAPPTPDAHAAKAATADDDFAFMDQTSVLDSSALKTRVQLSKRSRRRAPTSHGARRGRPGHAPTLEPCEEAADSVWMFKDSTEEKPPPREESDEEEKSPRAERTPGGHAQRTPAFPGVDPAVLKAQLHKRPEADSPGDPSSWNPQPKTPKSPFQPGVLGSRVLPPSLEKDERSDVASPLWLTELKSKKRQSLYENQV
ncbi:uncharacterized protein KIAA1671 homolog isoform X2 [Sorex araneus]|nr:uncharacterized protein KIAA1671 homolog isoform X2 [Sorex araneus]